MASIKKLTCGEEDFYPITSTDAIYFSDGTILSSHLTEIEQFNTLLTKYQELDSSIRDAMEAKLDGANVSHPVGLSISELLEYFSTASSSGGSTGGASNTGTKVRTLNIANGESIYNADVELIDMMDYIDCGESYTLTKTFTVSGYYGSMYLVFDQTMIYGSSDTALTYNILAKSSKGTVLKNVTHTTTIGSTITNSLNTDFDNGTTITFTATIGSNASIDTNIYVWFNAFAMFD